MEPLNITFATFSSVVQFVDTMNATAVKKLCESRGFITEIPKGWAYLLYGLIAWMLMAALLIWWVRWGRKPDKPEPEEKIGLDEQGNAVKIGGGENVDI